MDFKSVTDTHVRMISLQRSLRDKDSSDYSYILRLNFIDQNPEMGRYFYLSTKLVRPRP